MLVRAPPVGARLGADLEHGVRAAIVEHRRRQPVDLEDRIAVDHAKHAQRGAAEQQVEAADRIGTKIEQRATAVGIVANVGGVEEALGDRALRADNAADPPVLDQLGQILPLGMVAKGEGLFDVATRRELR